MMGTLLRSRDATSGSGVDGGGGVGARSESVGDPLLWPGQ